MLERSMREHMRTAYLNGWALIPLKHGSKEPLLPIGHPFLSRHPTEEEYKSFRWGNYGIVTGAVSNLCVLDIDGSDGIKSLKNNEVADVLDIETPMVWTPKGQHIYFKHNPAVKTSVGLLKGIDVRSTGAYVVGPGSVVKGHYYAWDELYGPEVPLADVPYWLVDKPTSDDSMQTEPIGDTIEDGKRNSTLASLAGYLVMRELPFPVVLNVLRLVNDAMCRPPLDDEEVIQVTKSIERCYMRHTQSVTQDVWGDDEI